MPRGAVPTVGELEARIDEALVIARASEEGVREVGEMALDAARQARRAAEAAESARAAAAVERCWAGGSCRPHCAWSPPRPLGRADVQPPVRARSSSFASRLEPSV